MRRRILLASAVPALSLLRALPARAAGREPFTDAAFDAAQAAGRAVVIEVTAPWCPVCRAQKPHVDAVMATPAMRDALLLSVDFDHQKAVLARLNVRSQSTLLAFHGRQERGRATGITDAASIRALMLSAL